MGFSKSKLVINCVFILSVFINAQSIKFTLGDLTYTKNVDGYYKLENGKEWKVVENQILVRLKSSLDFAKINLKKYGLDNLNFDNSFMNPGVYLVTILQKEDVFGIVNRLINSNLFDMVEPNLLGEYSDSTPNDSVFASQWNLATIKMTKAWDITRGSPNVTVAVVDNGADYKHEDLIGNLSDSIGYNCAHPNSTPYPYFTDQYTSRSWHGTACAGILAASTNNTHGVSGVAGGWSGNGVNLYYFNTADTLTNHPNLAYVQKAVNRAANTGLIKVLSMSLNLSDVGNVLQTAINNAVNNHGKIIVVSTANYGPGENENVGFPATMYNVIAVGASEMNNIRKKLSSEGDTTNEGNWGSCYSYQPDSRSPDLLAPGIHIWTTDIRGSNGATTTDYMDQFDGTSAACPHVAGVVALILSINPSLSPSTIKTILTSSAHNTGITNMPPAEYGAGILDAYKALKYTLTNYGGTLTQNLTIPADSTWIFQPGITVTFTNGASLIVNGTLTANGGNASTPITFDFTSPNSMTNNGIQFNSGSSGIDIWVNCI